MTKERKQELEKLLDNGNHCIQAPKLYKVLRQSINTFLCGMPLTDAKEQELFSSSNYEEAFNFAQGYMAELYNKQEACSYEVIVEDEERMLFKGIIIIK